MRLEVLNGEFRKIFRKQFEIWKSFQFLHSENGYFLSALEFCK